MGIFAESKTPSNAAVTLLEIKQFMHSEAYKNMEYLTTDAYLSSFKFKTDPSINIKVEAETLTKENAYVLRVVLYHKEKHSTFVCNRV